MMLTSTVVIGAGFGDEGKGLITDFEVRRQAAFLVARFNGGAQAGHTVVDGDKRHVFGHIGAGAFAGASTYLSSKFLVNPLLLAKEHKALSASLDRIGPISVHPRARVSTIYDMALNSMFEIARSQRHGSCGLGINETVTRHDRGYQLFAGDLWDLDTITQVLESIREEYVRERLSEMVDANKLQGEARQQFKFYNEMVLRDPQYVAEKLFEAAQFLTIGVPLGHQIAVFEGAQGLQLDEFMGVFPHVTRSVTGLPYALKAASELNIPALRPLYVTRAYQTRHGAGPLNFEGMEYAQKTAHDETNVKNPWQGELRFAPLNVFKLKQFVRADLERSQLIANTLGITIEKPKLAVTCLDQVGSWVNVVDEFGERVINLPTTKLPEYIGRALEMGVSHVSYGPENKDVRFFPAE